MEPVPERGQWPVDPQDPEPIDPTRMWIDGCFDFFHHGHARVMLQARQLGNELLVGLHSDEAILEHKGPTVMNLKERVAAANACRWVTKAVPHCPYVTDLRWVDHYGCQFVVHGDDITSDSSGEDTYRYVKQAGRMKIVRRTQGISTTDLVGRMLLCTKDHHIINLGEALSGHGEAGSPEERQQRASYMLDMFKAYATDESGTKPAVPLYLYKDTADQPSLDLFLQGAFSRQAGQRIAYVDGGFDLFSSGHIEFLRSVILHEEDLARQAGWYADAKVQQRIKSHGSDYGPVFVIAGIHGDKAINQRKHVNLPIMNIFERGLCLVQCKYVHSVVFQAPFDPSETFLKTLPYMPDVVYHGPTSYMELEQDPYTDAKRLGIFYELARHDFQDVDAGQIVDRIMKSRAQFEERQRRKGVKSLAEAEALRREQEQLAAKEAAANVKDIAS